MQVLIKMLCVNSVHWAVGNLYKAYFGLPACLAISLVLHATRVTRHAELPVETLVVHVGYSVVSAVMGMIGSVLLNKSMMHEEATKVSIVSASDVLISFGLQLVVLDVHVDVWSVCGSVAVLAGTCLVIATPYLEVAALQQQQQQHTAPSSLVAKILSFKF